jgi:hypothetical protein
MHGIVIGRVEMQERQRSAGAEGREAGFIGAEAAGRLRRRFEPHGAQVLHQPLIQNGCWTRSHLPRPIVSGDHHE